ncbi:hypothetical protein [Xanthobacter sediminis]
MSGNDPVFPLLVAVQELAARANSDPALADRLLAAPGDVIRREAGTAFPAGLNIRPVRDEAGVLRLTASFDDAFEGELDDGLLGHVAGGRSEGAGVPLALKLDFGGGAGSRVQKK